MPKISKGHRYVTILDAGSSGTRIYVYRYATDDSGRTIIPLELNLVYDQKFKYAHNDPDFPLERMCILSTQVSSFFEIFI